jgi:hypothetical protein
MMYRIMTLALAMICLVAGLAPADIICVPDPLVLASGGPEGELVVEYTGGGSDDLYGFSIDVEWDLLVATASGFSRPADGPFADADLFLVQDFQDEGEGRVRIDAALGGAQPGTQSGPLFTMTFTAVGDGGATTEIRLTINNLRNNANQPVENVATDDGVIFIDGDAPEVSAVLIANTTLPHTDDYLKDTDAISVTATVVDDDPTFGAANITADLTGLGGGIAANPDSYALGTATWLIPAAVCTPADGTITVTVTANDNASNTASAGDTIIADNMPPTPLLGVAAQPGHEQIHLAWTDATPNDLHPYGVEFRQAFWDDYPLYDTAAPAYPASHTDGALALQSTSGTTADWAQVPRGIYHLAGFAYDIVLNYSAAGSANTARATNYWLGDVLAPYDGEVEVLDVHLLGETYGLADDALGFDAACNVGPTDTGHPRGIPLPNADDEVGFEDLMVFALNFGVVAPELNLVPSGSPALAWRQLDPTTWALALERECAGLKGLNLRAALPGGVTCEVVPGEALQGQSSPIFLRNVPAHGLDAGLAVLGHGAGLAGSGDLIRVIFSAPTAVVPAVVARGLQNEDLSAEVSGVTAAPLPAVAGLEQNLPNPFNPRTNIAFSVPVAQHVQLTVFGVDGNRLRTLVDERREAGRHTITWDGIDDEGCPTSSGIYLYLLEMGDFRQVRKMVLLR